MANDGQWTIIGPLTTAFAPPPDCSQAKGMQTPGQGPNMVWGGACRTFRPYGERSVATYDLGKFTWTFGSGIVSTASLGKETFTPSSLSDNEPTVTITPASSCYPGEYAEFASKYQGQETAAFFSPGLACPSGWTATGIVTYGQRNPYDNDFGDNAASLALQPGETLVRCCPSGYKYYDTNGLDLCVSDVISTGSIVTSGFDTNCKAIQTTLSDVPNAGGVKPSTGGAFPANIRAVPLHLIVPRNATFQPPLQLPTKPKPSGLSNPAKIAVGIAVPLGVILFAILIFMLWRRNTKKKLRARAEVGHHHRAPAGQTACGKPELDGSHGAFGYEQSVGLSKPELDHSSTRAQLPSHSDSRFAVMELPAGNSFPAELGLKAYSAYNRHELPGNHLNNVAPQPIRGSVRDGS